MTLMLLHRWITRSTEPVYFPNAKPSILPHTKHCLKIVEVQAGSCKPGWQWWYLTQVSERRGTKALAHVIMWCDMWKFCLLRIEMRLRLRLKCWCIWGHVSKKNSLFHENAKASRDLHGPIWTSSRLGSRLSILRSKRFLQLSQRLQWMVSADETILSCHSSKVWDKHLHSSTLSNPEWLMHCHGIGKKSMFDLSASSCHLPEFQVPLLFFFFLPLWPSSINGKVRMRPVAAWNTESMTPHQHASLVFAGLLSFHHLRAFFSASLAFFLSSFLLEPPATGVWPETWSSISKYLLNNYRVTMDQRNIQWV